MITNELIENRINNFWGYGNLESPVWFIGMEEGFHGDLSDLEKRFIKTKNRSAIDLQDDMKDVKDHFKWFLPDSNIQKTWSRLILILLILNSDKGIDNNEIKEFQRKELGRLKSNHCLLDFMPLPCRSIKEKNWLYNQFGISYLKDRDEYKKEIMPRRIELFKKLIKKFNPRIIIFYSFTYLENWKKIVGCDLKIENSFYYCLVSRQLSSVG